MSSVFECVIIKSVFQQHRPNIENSSSKCQDVALEHQNASDTCQEAHESHSTLSAHEDAVQLASELPDGLSQLTNSKEDMTAR